MRRGCAQQRKGIDVRTRHTVLEFKSETVMRVHAPHTGIVDMTARHVVLATGAREESRAARLIGGTRQAGVMNTGTLQQTGLPQECKAVLAACHHWRGMGFIFGVDDLRPRRHSPGRDDCGGADN